MALLLFFAFYSVCHYAFDVEALTCQQCLGARNPLQCQTTTCAAGERCYLEETVTALQEVLYNLGCEKQQVCLSLSMSPFGRRHLGSRDARQVPSVTTCFRCCDSDFCNKGNCSVIDECASSPCSNGGTCENTEKGFVCHCPSGFRGSQCSQDVDECLSHPCQNGGTCINLAGNFTCTCPFKYEGKLCERESAGMVCQFCAGVSNPLLCNNPVVCRDNEECYADKVLSRGVVSYNMGCRTTAFCSFFKQHVQVGRETRQSHDITTCSDCCHHDDCNRDVCREDPKGTICMSCDNVKNPDDCHNVTVCDVTQECYGEQNMDLATGTQSFTYGCAAMQVCANVTKMAGGRRDVTMCLQCCDHHYCNKALCGGGSVSTTPAEPVDLCKLWHPCQNGATCTNFTGGYNCACSSFYAGRNCSETVDVCGQVKEKCKNGGSCTNDPDHDDGFVCSCAGFYTGKTCEQPVDVCGKGGKCENGGTCANTPGSTNGFTCQCTSLYTGQTCNQQVDPCLPNPCQHNATCSKNGTGFSCDCAFDFTGPLCEKGPSTVAQTTVPTTPPTTADPCLSSVCQHGGSCVVTRGTAKCACVGDYTGVHCEDSLCDSQHCHNGGSCHLTQGSVTCSCHSNFTGQHCETRVCDVIDIDSIGCGSPQDVAVLMSGGGRTTAAVAQHMVHFVETLVQYPKTRVDPSHTHVAVAFYHSSPHTIVPLSDFPKLIVDTMRKHDFYKHYHGSNSDIHLGKALDHAREHMFSYGRSDSAKVILVILNDVDADTSEIVAATKRLKDECISLIIIALEGSNMVANVSGSKVAPTEQGLTRDEAKALSAILSVFGNPGSHLKYVATSDVLDSSLWNQFFESSPSCATSTHATHSPQIHESIGRSSHHGNRSLNGN